MTGKHLTAVRKMFVLGVDTESRELRWFEGVVGDCISTVNNVEVNDIGVGTHSPVLASMCANACESLTRYELVKTVFEERLKTFDDDGTCVKRMSEQENNANEFGDLHLLGKFLKFSL